MPRPPLHSIFWSFLRIGALAFGGGIASLPVFEAELATRRRWFSATEMTESFAIAQSIPGVIIVNFAVLAGLRLAGKRGALLATVAVVLPAFFIILALAAFCAGQWNNRWISAALSGLRPAVVAIVAAAALRLARVQLRRPGHWLAAIAGTSLLLAGILAPVPLILIGAGTGVLLQWLCPKPERKP